jgi:phosphatidylglycerol:prolipoprotein diacylglycerol transferase
LPIEWHGHTLPLHAICEALGYALGFQAYRRLKAHHGDVVASNQRFHLVIAAILGALIGSKIPGLWDHFSGVLPLRPWISSKTVAGGLMGGFFAVEIVKRKYGIRHSTGNLWVLPVILGMVLGRLGCFLAGPTDGTWGIATSMPWAVQTGSGPALHPTPLYEISFLVICGFLLHRVMRMRPHWNSFRLFLMVYLGFRLAIDTLKLDPRIGWGMSSIQWLCLFGIGLLLADYRKLSDSRPELPVEMKS